jgi:hypothetical protein
VRPNVFGRVVTLQHALMAANACVWLYFFLSFSSVAYPFQRDILGHPSGTGYTFWGHSIGLNESASLYRFFEVIFWIEFPSFAAVFPLARRLLPYEFSDGFFLGLSEDAWLLLLVVIVSFFQWYVIGRVLARISANSGQRQIGDSEH